MRNSHLLLFNPPIKTQHTARTNPSVNVWECVCMYTGGKKEPRSEIIRSFEFIVYINLQTRKIPVILETVIRTSSFLPSFTAIYLKLKTYLASIHVYSISLCRLSFPSPPQLVFKDLETTALPVNDWPLPGKVCSYTVNSYRC